MRRSAPYRLCEDTRADSVWATKIAALNFVHRPSLLGETMSNNRIIDFLAGAGVLVICGQAIAQGGPNVAALAQSLAQALGVGTPVAFTLNPFIGITTYSVPVGQRLVIEYVSGLCPNPPPYPIQLPGLEVTTRGFLQLHGILSHEPMGNSVAGPSVNFGNLVKIYADAGSTVTLDGNSCRVTVSGQLVTP
jgi:hypothetical protein